MSALGQKQTLTFRSDDARFTSTANIEATQTDVRFVPKADIARSFPTPQNHRILSPLRLVISFVWRMQ
jgi:hypothetical protein